MKNIIFNQFTPFSQKKVKVVVSVPDDTVFYQISKYNYIAKIEYSKSLMEYFINNIAQSVYNYDNEYIILSLNNIIPLSASFEITEEMPEFDVKYLVYFINNENFENEFCDKYGYTLKDAILDPEKKAQIMNDQEMVEWISEHKLIKLCYAKILEIKGWYAHVIQVNRKDWFGKHNWNAITEEYKTMDETFKWQQFVYTTLGGPLGTIYSIFVDKEEFDEAFDFALKNLNK